MRPFFIVATVCNARQRCREPRRFACAGGHSRKPDRSSLPRQPSFAAPSRRSKCVVRTFERCWLFRWPSAQASAWCMQSAPVQTIDPPGFYDDAARYARDVKPMRNFIAHLNASADKGDWTCVRSQLRTWADADALMGKISPAIRPLRAVVGRNGFRHGAAAHAERHPQAKPGAGRCHRTAFVPYLSLIHI